MSAAVDQVHRPTFGRSRALLALTLPLALAGCASAKVFEITAVAPPPARLATIVVEATAPDLPRVAVPGLRQAKDRYCKED